MLLANRFLYKIKLCGGFAAKSRQTADRESCGVCKVRVEPVAASKRPKRWNQPASPRRWGWCLCPGARRWSGAGFSIAVRCEPMHTAGLEGTGGWVCCSGRFARRGSILGSAGGQGTDWGYRDHGSFLIFSGKKEPQS